MKRHSDRVTSSFRDSRPPRPTPASLRACAIALGALAGCTPTSFFDTYPSFDSFAGVVALADGGLIVGGHADGSLLPAGAALLRVDAAGTPLWALRYPSEAALDSFPDEIAPMSRRRRRDGRSAGDPCQRGVGDPNRRGRERALV